MFKALLPWFKAFLLCIRRLLSCALLKPLIPWCVSLMVLFSTSACTDITHAKKNTSKEQSNLQNSQQIIQQQLQASYPNLTLKPTQQHLPDQPNTSAQPLTLQAAIQYMLTHSSQIDIAMNRLSSADAEALQSTLIAGPRFSLALLTANNNQWSWDFGFMQSLSELFSRQRQEKIGKENLIAAQLFTSQSILTAINAVQQQYFTAVAAQQQLTIQKNKVAAEEAKKALAESLYNAGNVSELHFLTYVSELQKQQRLLTAEELKASRTKAELAYLLGNFTIQIELPDQLPQIPIEKFDEEKLRDTAYNQKIDLQLSQQQKRILEQELALVSQQYGVSDSSIGLLAKRENDATRSNGVQAEFNLPFSKLFDKTFDRGQAKRAKINSEIAGNATEIKQLQTKTALEIKLALASMNTAVTRQYQLDEEEKTLTKRTRLMQHEVNYMLRSPFDLLDSHTDLIALEQEKSEVRLDYWQARAQLEMAIGKELPLLLTQTPSESEHSTNLSDEHATHRHD